MTKGIASETPFIMLAMPINRDLPSGTVHSLMRTQVLMFQKGIPLSFNTYDGCSLVHKARNCLTWDFLKSDCTHLFWVDSDLTWDAETFLKFVVLGNKHDMLCGAYPKKDDKPTFFMAPLHNRVTTNEFGCVEIKRIANGFSIMRREVVEALARSSRKIKMDHDGPAIPFIYKLDDDGEELRGEDMRLCEDVRALGYKIWLDPNVAIGHVGQKTYNHKISDHMTRVEVPVSEVAKCA